MAFYLAEQIDFDPYNKIVEKEYNSKLNKFN